MQSLWAFYLGIRVGAILLGLPPQTKQGCLQSAAQSHYARTHNDSHTKPLHDATAQMAVNAQMQWHKWLTTCTGVTPQSKDALVACQKFCTMQNQQSKQHSTPHFQKTQRFIDRLKRALAFTDARFSVYCLSNLRSNHLSRYSVCKRYAKICGDVFGRKTAQLPKMSFTITKKAMRYQDELHNLPIWVMSFC